MTTTTLSNMALTFGLNKDVCGSDVNEHKMKKESNNLSKGKYMRA